MGDLNQLNGVERVTPLIKAAEYNRLEVVKVLLANGARPNLQDRVLQTALHRAACNGHLDMCKMLVGSRADPTLQDVTLRTPRPRGVQQPRRGGCPSSESAELVKNDARQSGHSAPSFSQRDP